MRLSLVLAGMFLLPGLEAAVPTRDQAIDQAMALRAQGPSGVLKALALVQAAHEARGGEEQLDRLLAILLLDARRPGEALAVLEGLTARDGKARIVPSLAYLRARALEAMDRRAEARQILEAHQAFWQADAALQPLVASLRSELEGREAFEAGLGEGLQRLFRLCRTGAEVVAQVRGGHPEACAAVLIRGRDRALWGGDEELSAMGRLAGVDLGREAVAFLPLRGPGKALLLAFQEGRPVAVGEAGDASLRPLDPVLLAGKPWPPTYRVLVLKTDDDQPLEALSVTWPPEGRPGP